METRLHAQPKTASPPSFTPVREGVLQRKCACGGSSGLTGECADCDNKKLSLQRSTQSSEVETRHAGGVLPIVDEVLRSPGQPLDTATREFMEPRFGYDFSHVRIHANDPAARSAASVNALAYTIGSHIAFGSGTYAPATDSGRELIAHELTHTIQQSRDSSGSGISQPEDRSEREAEQVAQKIMVGAAGGFPADDGLGPNKPTGGTESIVGNGARVALNPPFRLQRSPDDGSTASAESDQPESAAPSAPAGLIVEDDAAELADGQMRKSDFLAQVGSTVSPILPEAQVGAFNEKMGFYQEQSSQRLEADIHNYVPETNGATAASEYIQSIREQVEKAAPAGQGAGSASGGDESGASENAAFKSRDGSSPADTGIGSIRAQLGAGTPLDNGAKSRMETAFGYDFSGVRIHTDDRATSLSSGFDARAFTVGSDIAFGAGEYQPGTLIGEALLAHELAHVVQQGGGSTSATQSGGTYGDLEEDADRSAVGAMISLWGGAKSALAGIARNAMPSLRSGLRLQRCNGGGRKVIRYRLLASSGFSVCSYCACTKGGCVDQLPGPGPERPCPPGREIEWDGCTQIRNVPLSATPCETSEPGVRCL